MIIADDRCPEYLILDNKNRQCMLERGHKAIKHKHNVSIGDTSFASEGHADDHRFCSVTVQWHLS